MGNGDEIKGPAGETPRPPRRPASRPVPAHRAQAAAARQSDEGRELMVRSRSLFLRDVEQQLAKKELYNLDEEFEKTKHNRSPFVWLSVLIFVSVMVVVAILVTSYIQSRSQNVQVNISTFADVNLRDLLDKAKQLDNQLDVLKQDLATLQTNEASDIQNVRSNEAAQIQFVNTQTISSDEKGERIDGIREQANGQIAALRAQYGPKIDADQAKIAATQKSLDAYDTRQVAQAKKQEAILNNQQRLFDLQMQKTTQSYQAQISGLTSDFDNQIATLKRNDADFVSLLKRNQASEIASLIATYNPTFSEPGIVSILAAPTGTVGSQADGYSKLAESEGVASAASDASLQSRLQDFAGLLSRLEQVPYKNSVPGTLDHLQYLHEEIVYDYQQIANGMAAKLSDQNETVARYNFALDSLIKNSRENGYIIDPRNTADLAVFIDPVYKVSDGDTAYVFRNDDQQIATIVLHVSGETITGSLSSLNKAGTPMQPFDKILLNLKQ